jgi:hypothetical protein
LKYAIIPVDWKSIVKDQDSNTTNNSFPGDEIEVAAFNEGVKVTGNVLTSEIPYDKGRGLDIIWMQLGGVDAKGWKKKVHYLSQW